MTIELTEPNGLEAELASSHENLVFFPRKVDSNGRYQHESSAITIRKLLREQGIDAEVAEGDAGRSDIQENAFELILPVIFVGAACATANPHVYTILINVLSSYIYDFFQGIQDDKKVRASFVVRKANGQLTKIRYSGPPEQFKDIKDIIEAERDDDRE